VHRPRHHLVPHRVHAPAAVYYHHERPYYFHAGFGLYLGNAALSIHLVDAAPAGYVYRDPYCDATFGRVADYRRHLHRHHHRPLLDLVLGSAPACD
jgi:hypothetical protein